MNAPFLLDRCREMRVGNQILKLIMKLLFDGNPATASSPREASPCAQVSARVPARPATSMHTNFCLHIQRCLSSAFQLALRAVERPSCSSEVDAPLLHRLGGAQSTTMAFGATLSAKK